VVRCKDCGLVDLEFIQKWDDDYAFIECPECGALDSHEEIDEDQWIEEMID
jgi:translation initiation factor 2 beta subunit (eIF-2beta)/eIF-5